MNRKGFTLIELLAVILILSGISIVAVVSISSSLERRSNKECEEQIAIVKNAAKIYFSLNGYTDDGVTVGCLHGDGTDACKTNYLDNYKTQTSESQLPGTLTIKIVDNKEYKIFDGSQEYICPN